jgi:hypothetical protein
MRPIRGPGSPPHGEDGHADARGAPADRNAELIVGNAWAHARR